MGRLEKSLLGQGFRLLNLCSVAHSDGKPVPVHPFNRSTGSIDLGKDGLHS